MCTCPNYLLPIGTHVDKNMQEKTTYKFLGHHQWKALRSMNQNDPLMLLPFVEVPCGKCLECRIQYARAWADRCVLEAKQYKYNYFVTLTYDDEFLPNRNSLEPKDLQLFIKRLRKHYSKKYPDIKIRFLACGEYGDKSWRPHYHIILFNCPIDDLSYVFQKSKVEDYDLTNGKPIFGRMENHLRPDKGKDGNLMFSKTIYELWHRQGMISVAPFCYDTAAYVSQYVTKKCNPANQHIYEELKIYPEFLRMSNRPGIGAQYFHDHDDEDLFLHKIIIPQDGEAHLSAVPRYYDKLFIKKYGEDVFSPIRLKRVRDKLQNLNTSVSIKRDKDSERRIKDYNLKKIHHLREGI